MDRLMKGSDKIPRKIITSYEARILRYEHCVNNFDEIMDEVEKAIMNSAMQCRNKTKILLPNELINIVGLHLSKEPHLYAVKVITRPTEMEPGTSLLVITF